MLTARKSYLDRRKVISKEDTDYQNLIRNKEVHYVMTRWIIIQEDKTIFKVYSKSRAGSKSYLKNS